MPTAANPVEFTKELDERHGLQRCGNRVRPEGPDGAPNTVTNPIFVTDVWRVTLVADEGANDNDKTVITVPAGEEIQVLWIWIEFVSDATVADRQLVVEVQDSANDVIGQVRVGQVQAASLTRYYMLAPTLADHLAFRDTDYLMTPLPAGFILRAGDQLRVYDNNNVSAADDMVVQVQIGEREI